MTFPRARVLPALAVAALALLAACSGTTAPSGASSPAPPVVRPVGAQDPAVVAGGSAAPPPSCDPLASYRPAGSLPVPGAMPAGSTMDRIAKRGRVILGVSQNTLLFGYRDPATNEIVGFDVDIAREVARAIFGDPTNRVQLTAVTSAQRIPYLQNGTVDLVAATMTVNCARWQQVNFSTVYYLAGQTVLVPASSPAKSIDDLGGRKVCAAAGSTSLANLAAAKSKPVPVSVPDWTDCLVMLQQGQVDAISTDDSILRGLAAQDPNTKLIGDRFTQEPYGLAMSQSATDFTKFVNGVLDKIRGNGTWAAIYTRWLGGPAPVPPAPVYRD